ncbi:tRNA1(Val) A37 N6-methylase TrmN6 [Entomoplasma freundtii]|uniref:Methyltransferase n=1 Tax=Entomoplasma freundtii TaxID=74700 RepID=A0A2K8NU73_9MOLU|nr:tRNA1(Val) (adenine(37)-N6)-methyltransferase [Entomoplasma freundtii]ATZ16718.1 methyltransferase [Entomoplasma freundtii]TDY58115.1 tRNA1(Val) A37 N6-methylase TrmN6 [Entomoplasma freundtii]
MKILNTILNYSNRTLYQETEMFSFTLDSILVARFLNLNSRRKRIVDFGTNNAIIPLIISKYTEAEIVGLEIHPEAVALARENVELNHLEKQISIVETDIKDYAQVHNQEFDVVICNPPFFKMEGKPKLKEQPQKIQARHEVLITLEEIIASAAKVLKNGGVLTMVHRAERTSEILLLLERYRFTPKRMQFVYSKAGQKAKTLLIDAVLNGKEGNDILPPLIAHQDDESYTPELLAMFRD